MSVLPYVRPKLDRRQQLCRRGGQYMTPEHLARLTTLREKFDALLIKEINVYGGIPIFADPCAHEQMELREAIAGLLNDEDVLLRTNPVL